MKLLQDCEMSLRKLQVHKCCDSKQNEALLRIVSLVVLHRTNPELVLKLPRINFEIVDSIMKKLESKLELTR